MPASMPYADLDRQLAGMKTSAAIWAGLEMSDGGMNDALKKAVICSARKVEKIFLPFDSGWQR